MIDNIEEVIFLVISDDVVDFWDFKELLWVSLSVAACDEDEGMGVSAFKLADEVSGFGIAFIGDGTGINDIDIGVLFMGDDLVSGFLEGMEEAIGFELIETASECCDGDRFFIHIILMYFNVF